MGIVLGAASEFSVLVSSRVRVRQSNKNTYTHNINFVQLHDLCLASVSTIQYKNIR